MVSPVRPLLERGVHVAAYLMNGCYVLHAIDAKGNCLRRVRLAEDVDEECARVWLQGILDHYDPLPLRPVLTLHTNPRIPPGTFAVLTGTYARLR
jgi:hypothetical protein